MNQTLQQEENIQSSENHISGEDKPQPYFSFVNTIADKAIALTEAIFFSKLNQNREA
ncbi:hypothetical protein SAMN06295967_10772 [Belliella buryatensis]|uniref:Uncharacterized protein n=1 Tax=Belliella buryatensis TaxID=1500549 RepID=A0A239DIP9_9BACT|nr:hypothetical protein [Belliella buryatensis]SNS32109.1 hypothetical protein SAMN06295967_10772 [Belliella buryatensis]